MKRLALIISLILIGLFVRLLFLSHGGATIDSDEAIVGLMARHIQEGREWPIFYYGQHYMGSLEPTLISLIFNFTDQNEWTLKIVPLFFSLIFIYQVFLLAEKFGGKKTALVAAFLAAVPPVGFVEWSTKARGGFIELVVLGTAALIIAIDVYRQNKPKISSLSLLAFILGIAWWVNNQAIFYIVAIGLFLIVPLIKKLGLKQTAIHSIIAGACFFIGGTPFWYYNLFTHPRLQTFKQLGGHAKFPSEVLSHLHGFFSEALPILLGARRFWTRYDLFPYSSVLSYAVAIAGILVSLYCISRKNFAGKNSGTSLLYIFILTTPLIFAFSAFGWLTTAPRYLLPLYSVWFVILALGINMRIGWLPAFAFFTLSLASNYLHGISFPGQPYVANGERVSKDHTELIDWLISKNIPHIYTNYWIGYRIAFETKERVTFSVYSEPFMVRIPRYENIGEEYQDIAPFVLVPSQEDEVANSLIELSIPFERTVVSGYVILSPLYVPQFHPQEEVETTFTSSSSRVDWLKKISDNAPETRWGSGAPQSPGMFVEGSFKKDSLVKDVEIDVGFWATDAARHLSLQLLTPNDGACLVFEGSTLPLHDFYGPTLNFKVAGSGGEAKLARGIRLEQEGRDPVFDWSLADVRVYSELDDE